MGQIGQLHAGAVQIAADILKLSKAYSNYPVEEILALICRDIGCYPDGMMDEREARAHEPMEEC